MKKVDMSSEAITRRLRQVDQLRELSLSLMKAKKLSDEKAEEEKEKKRRKQNATTDFCVKCGVEQIVYRKLKPTDALAFRRLRLECLQNFPEKMGTSLEDEAGKPKLHFEEQIERESPDFIFYGAFDDDRLIGIAGFVRGERVKTRHTGEVVSMYVTSGFQGQNVGERILRALLDAVFEIDGIEQAFLTVFADNAAAVRLYERIGFETFGVQKNYFKLGEKHWNRRFMQLMKDQFLS
jgi:ribosomal protein S18 acetylase RimI-like enzyme